MMEGDTMRLDGSFIPQEEVDVAMVEGPAATLLQDRALGRPSWRYVSSLERPWTATTKTLVTLRT